MLGNEAQSVHVIRVSWADTLQNDIKRHLCYFRVQWYFVPRNTAEPIRKQRNVSQLVEAYARGSYLTFFKVLARLTWLTCLT
jgi:hypothetical protein